MKIFVLTIILLSLYLIYRLSFPKQTSKGQGNETPPSEAKDDYGAVVKKRYVLPSQSNSKRRDDNRQESDKQYEKANIFAAGNSKPDASVIPKEELNEVFGEEVNPEELDIEPDESETDGSEAPDAEEEAEEIRQSVGAMEGYAEGYTYGELTEAIHDAGKQTEAVSKATVETLRSLTGTDMFEQLVSSHQGRALQIASILDRSEQSLVTDSNLADNGDMEGEKLDIEQFLVE